MMNENSPFSNFSFLQEINKELFDQIHKAESQARINFVVSGQLMRQSCELFVKSVIESHGLAKYFGDRDTLSSKLKSLRDASFLKRAGFLKEGQMLTDHPLLPNLGKMNYVSNSGRVFHEIDYYTFLTRLGNSCSHNENQDYSPVINFANIENALKGYRRLYFQYYASEISKSDHDGGFDANRLPVGNYNIESAVVPKDKLHSMCALEMRGYSLNSRQEIDYYAILRLYNKSDVDANFMLRNSDVFLEASRETISGIPEGMTSFQEVAELSSNSSSFYITAHLFRYKPRPLSAKLLKDSSMKQKLEICLGICSCIANLHQAETPIYHRLLTYDSVVICSIRDKLVPYVIKFDYGKLDVSDQRQTVFQNAREAEQQIQNEKKLRKYLAPEWKTITDSSKVNWEKMDVYALGVLFSDILTGRFDGNIVSFDELEDLELSDDLLDTIDDMISERIMTRPPLTEVQEILQDELRRWKKK